MFVNATRISLVFFVLGMGTLQQRTPTLKPEVASEQKHTARGVLERVTVSEVTIRTTSTGAENQEMTFLLSSEPRITAAVKDLVVVVYREEVGCLRLLSMEDLTRPSSPPARAPARAPTEREPFEVATVMVPGPGDEPKSTRPTSPHPAPTGPPSTFSTYGFRLVDNPMVTLSGVLPPLLPVSGKAIQVISEDGNSPFMDNVRESLIRQITVADPTVSVTPQSAEIVIELLSSEEQNPASSPLNGARTSVVAYRVLAVKSGTVQGGTVSTKFGISKRSPASKSLGMTIPSSPFLSKSQERDRSSFDLATNIARDLVRIGHAVNVPLAQGEALNAANRLALNGLWSQDFEALELVPLSTDKRQEAYRSYDLGVANEALAYQTSEPRTAIKYLQEAMLSYKTASQILPAERSFIPPQVRITEAVGRYSTLDKLDLSSNSPSARVTFPALRNEDIIALVRAKITDETILQAISDAPEVKFDLSDKGEGQLIKNGVGSNVVAAMKSRSSQAKHHE